MHALHDPAQPVYGCFTPHNDSAVLIQILAHAQRKDGFFRETGRDADANFSNPHRVRSVPEPTAMAEAAGDEVALPLPKVPKMSDKSWGGEVGGKPFFPSKEAEDRYYRHIWHVIAQARRHRKPKRREFPMGVHEFFRSALAFEWLLFAGSLVLFVPLQYILLRASSTKLNHVFSLLVWLVMGLIYNILVWRRLGKEAGLMWFTGYLLELIFSVENVFVFHIVVKAFRTPDFLTSRALSVVIFGQIAFEMVFFMGLAAHLRTFDLLPYILGVWLVYIGFLAAREEKQHDMRVEETWPFHIIQRCLGDRLHNKYDEIGNGFMLKDDLGRFCASMLVPMTLCLLLVDFLLEVDVALTKIEELPNQYISFTSSAVAAFLVPPLFFVAEDLFRRFALLKYGISFVLIFFGVQMLAHHFITIGPLSGCAIIGATMVLCVAFSALLGLSEAEVGDVSCVGITGGSGSQEGAGAAGSTAAAGDSAAAGAGA